MAKDSTVVVGATQNKPTEITVANSDAVYAVKGIRGRINQFGDVVLQVAESNIPKWDEDENGNDVLIKANSYTLPLNRFLARMHKEEGFDAYWDEVRANREEIISSRCNNALLNNVENIASALQDKSNDKALSAILDAISTDNRRNMSRSENRRVYGELLTQVCFDGTFVPLEIGESFTYTDGTESQNTDICRIAFDFNIRLHPDLRSKLAAYKVAVVNTDDWQ